MGGCCGYLVGGALGPVVLCLVCPPVRPLLRPPPPVSLCRCPLKEQPGPVTAVCTARGRCSACGTVWLGFGLFGTWGWCFGVALVGRWLVRFCVPV